jgi:hypothetical protein
LWGGLDSISNRIIYLSAIKRWDFNKIVLWLNFGLRELKYVVNVCICAS